MSNDIQTYKPYLEVLEMLLPLDEEIADSYFYEFSSLVSDKNYMSFYHAYLGLKSQANQTCESSHNDSIMKSPIKARIMESAILLQINPEWAETRFKYWVEKIQRKTEREVYCCIYRAMKSGRISFRIIPANKQEALSWLQILMKVSMEYADLYYEEQAAKVISREEYSTLKVEELNSKLYGIAFRDLDMADRFYRDHAAEIVPKDTYLQLKRRVIRKRLKLLLEDHISEADAFYRSYGHGFMSLEEYHQIKRPVLVDLLGKACAHSTKEANTLFEDKAKGIVSQAVYDSIRKPFIIRELRDLCAVSLERADAFYRQEAFSVVSEAEYEEILVKPRTMAKLQEICETSIRDADRFFENQAIKVIDQKEYDQIKRPALLKQLKAICEQSILKADALFADCARNVVTLQEYTLIKHAAFLKRLQNEYPENQLSTDQYYETYAKDYITVGEYNIIRRPVVADILKDKCGRSLRDAQSFYMLYAKDILTENEYSEICKPFYLADLHRLFAENYMGALKYHNDQLIQIISTTEFYKEAAAFVLSWFEAEKSKGRFKKDLPDFDQAKAISMIHGNVLVTARAGSGKTATMINRAYFMIKHCQIPAEQILMLAFNRDAAKQMRERLESLFNDGGNTEPFPMPSIMTFHALAFQLVLPQEAILYDEKKGPQMQSRLLQENIIGEYLKECLNISPGFAANVRKLMMNYFRSEIDDRKYLPRDEFLHLIRSASQESLKGDAVKSYGEKRIANFLFEHDVEYIYEHGFRWKGRPYRPDFTIPTKKLFGKKSGLVIEYLGLQGDPEYDQQTEEKREFWESHPEWHLIEIYPKDINKSDSEFEIWFKEILKKHRIHCKKLSEDEIWERAKKQAINDFTKAMLSFIQRCRKRYISPDDLHAYIQQFSDGAPEELLFAELAEKFYRSYINRVKVTGQDDFDGLMIRAIDKVKAGDTVFRGKKCYGDLSRIQFIAIDEYQDFSELFYRLITAIRQINHKVNLYCVGDDWQAINGFAGSDLRFFQDFDHYFGQSIHVELLNNYRSDKVIVDVGNALMHGLGAPGRVAPSVNHEIGKVCLCYAEDFSPTKQEKEKYGLDYISPMVRRIIHKQQKHNHSVALLDRRSMVSKDISSGEEDMSERTRELSALKENMKTLFPGIDLVSSTVHSFKGLERDAVILLDVTDRCFPLIHPNWRFSRIIGESIDEIIEAERRLFYVALTRAKCDLYLLTERENKSGFLKPICEYAEVSPIDWREYPSDLDIGFLSIEVGNQPGRGASPTQDIRELLKQAGFYWSPDQKVWTKSIDKAAFDPEHLQQEDWYVKACGIVINIYDSDRKLVDAYII